MTIKEQSDAIPTRYWNLSGALYAYLYIELAKQGIDVIGESQLVGYPSQFPTVSMINWEIGKPNARYWVLSLLKNNFHVGDKLVETRLGPNTDIAAQAFITPRGKKIIVINKRNRTVSVVLPDGLRNLTLSTVDETTGEGPPSSSKQDNSTLQLAPFAVTVVTLP